ncbi:hypothetical protein BU197_26985 [Streptomyces sp. CBMA291]|nr:hypothetical protein [Streptomyces sp. CBMA291]MBD0717649.1 hypothetical protein [Streptomyces sp. CBMA370]
MLIGVGRTPMLDRHPGLAGLYRPLLCVAGDVRRIEEALLASGYTVTSFHPEHPDKEHREPSKDLIDQAVVDFLGACAPGDTAFVYVSAHGVTIDGADHILPSSARPSARGELIARTLIPASIPGLLGDVPDGVSVTICLDTCRTDAPGSTPKRQPVPHVGNAHDHVFWLLAAGRGEAAFADPERGSLFGLALAEALSPLRPPQTLGEIKDFVQARVARLARTLHGPPPTVELKTAAGREDHARGLRLCRGSQETVHWAELISGSVLWKHTSGTDAVHERVKEGLGELAAEVARSRHETGSALDMPWHDPDYPERVLRVLGHLVEQAGLSGTERLSPAETATLLAAPLLHEGVVALALGELTTLRPDRLEKDRGAGDPLRPHDRLVCEGTADICRAHPRVVLAAETLRQRRLAGAATAADHWLRHRFIADWDRLWDRTEDYPAVNLLLDMVVTAVSAGAEGTTAPHPADLDRHLRRVLPHMTVAPGSTPRIDASENPGWSRTLRPVPGNRWRAWDLAYLLWLAALLAADPRRMSGVLVDHLGAHQPLVPADAVAALAGSGWETVDRDGVLTYALRLNCPHPALHAALEELVASADASVRALHRRWHDNGHTAPDLLRGVPRKVTTEFLQPVDRSYTAPLERFRLAEDEIRPLLMGTPLYGDRMLAVRELYQNALDACRYREQRTAYGVRRQLFQGTPPVPEIHFVQGYDGDRPYIECRDEGSGMSREKLTSMFARAGRRYAQDPDYVQERRDWRRAGLDPVSLNSRFGIGVFSYFMLADEVTVHTETIDPYGNPSRTSVPLHASVQSGSGLLQIREVPGGPGSGGGTTVRLYLSHERDGEDPPSVVETLRRLLWVSEYPVTAVEWDREGREIRSEGWEPGVLRAPAERAGKWYGGAATRAGEGGWIVQGTGQLLLDGILVEEAPDVEGFVFNLRERHRPEPSVNRNSLLSYDEEAVREELLRAVPHAARAVDEVQIIWLWGLIEEEPRLAVALFDHLPPGAVGVLGPSLSPQPSRPVSTLESLRRRGVLRADASCLETWQPQADTPDQKLAENSLFKKWRLTALGALAYTESEFAPAHYPEPQGLDALVVTHKFSDGGWTAPLAAAALAHVPLTQSLRSLRRYAIAGALVPSVPHLTRLREAPVPTQEMADLCDGYEDTAPRGLPETRIAHASLLAVAAHYQVPPTELLPALTTLRHLDARIPDLDVLNSVDLTRRLPETASRLLVEHAQSVEGRQGGAVTPLVLLHSADQPAQRRRLAEWITTMAPLGLAYSDTVSDETLDHPALSLSEMRMMSRNLDSRHPFLPTGPMPLLHLVRCAKLLSRSLGESAREVARLAPVTGVSAPVLPSECEPWHPAPWIPQEVGFHSSTYPSWALLVDAFSNTPQPSPEELRRELVLLDACGCLTDSVDTLVEQFECLTPSLVNLLGHSLSPRAKGGQRWGLEAGEFRTALLLQVAADSNTTLGILHSRLTRANVRIPFRLPTLPKQARALAPSPADAFWLLQSTDKGYAFRNALPLQHLLAYAQAERLPLGPAAHTIQSYQCLGGPTLPGPLSEELADFRPTDFDLAAFGKDLLGPGLLDPLHLVLTAGRLGWTLGETYDRYAPFACLGLRVTVPPLLTEEQEIVPGWRDVIVLTEELTGRAPALAGTVSDAHVVYRAEETEQSEEDVRSGLRRYARLFSLDVPAAEGPRP